MCHCSSHGSDCDGAAGGPGRRRRRDTDVDHVTLASRGGDTWHGSTLAAVATSSPFPVASPRRTGLAAQLRPVQSLVMSRFAPLIRPAGPFSPLTDLSSVAWLPDGARKPSGPPAAPDLRFDSIIEGVPDDRCQPRGDGGHP